jgi:predicted CopG family antitoxin
MNPRLKKELKMIAVEKSNYDRLRMLGHVPQSFNDIITELLDKHDAAGAATKVK